jgi:Zn-dependent oligopeptidase
MSVEGDFAELPSQMLENWIWDKQILKKISSHYLTKKALPDALIESIINGRHQSQASATLTKVFYGTLDILLYSAFDDDQLR